MTLEFRKEILRKHQELGMTLVEMMVAVGIFSLVLVAATIAYNRAADLADRHAARTMSHDTNTSLITALNRAFYARDKVGTTLSYDFGDNSLPQAAVPSVNCGAPGNTCIHTPAAGATPAFYRMSKLRFNVPFSGALLRYEMENVCAPVPGGSQLATELPAIRAKISEFCPNFNLHGNCASGLPYVRKRLTNITTSIVRETATFPQSLKNLATSPTTAGPQARVPVAALMCIIIDNVPTGPTPPNYLTVRFASFYLSVLDSRDAVMDDIVEKVESVVTLAGTREVKELAP